jgi:hypothetical protein
MAGDERVAFTEAAFTGRRAGTVHSPLRWAHVGASEDVRKDRFRVDMHAIPNSTPANRLPQVEDSRVRLLTRRARRPIACPWVLDGR